MTGAALVQLLDEYAERIRNLPVPALVDPADDPSADRFRFEDAMRWRALGLTVVDRLLPGATPQQIAAYEEWLGAPLPPECRAWFEWSNGHLGGLADDEDPVACVLPYGRQLDLDASRNVASTMREDLRIEVEHACVIMQWHWMNLVVECGQKGRGVVWLDQGDNPPMETAYASLTDLVRGALRLLDLGWVNLNDYGTPELASEEVLEHEGVVFADDWERYWYRSYGRIPRSVAGPS